MSRNEWSTEKLISRLLNNKSEKTYWNNIRVLRSRPTIEVLNKSIELTHHSDAKARRIGIDVLAQLGISPRPFYDQSNKCFFELLNIENNPKVLMSLFYAIGHNNEKLSNIQIEKLCEFVDSPNELVIEGLVHALLGIDKPKAIDALIKLSTHKLSHIRDWATFGLGSLVERDNKKIRVALWNRVNDKHNDTKAEAILGLALRNDSGIIDIIHREVLSEEYDTMLLEAIIAINGIDLLPVLEHHLAKLRNNQDINADWLSGLENCIMELRTKASNE